MRILFVILLFVGAAQVYGGQVETDGKPQVLPFDETFEPKNIIENKSIGDILNGILKYFTPSDPIPEDMPVLPISQIKGRLLTSEEGCGVSKVANTKIVGGQTSKPGAWPWLALIGYRTDKGYGFACGGTLITSRHILTAAHCVNENLTFVRLGEFNTSTNTDGPHKDVLVSKVLEHRYYHPLLRINDIAVLELLNDVEFTDRIRPVCLPVKEPTKTKSFVGSNPFIAGWGRWKEEGDMSSTLQQAQVPIQDNDICEAAFYREGELLWDHQFFDGVICAGAINGGKDTCQGDSGGPLMLPVHENGNSFPFYQIGIVSYGIGCGRPYMPGVYTNVAFFSEWIKGALRTLAMA